MGKQVDDVKAANSELMAAQEISAKRNKNIFCWTVFVIVLLCILGGSVYLLAQ